MSESLADIARRFIDAAEDRGYFLEALDMRGAIVLRNPYTDVTYELRGVLTTPEMVRALPKCEKPERKP